MLDLYDCVFDLLKIRYWVGQLQFTVFGFRTAPDIAQVERQGTGQKLDFFFSHWTLGQFFVLYTSYTKYQNNVLPTKHCIRQNLSNILNVCHVLFYAVLFCQVLTFFR
jgi:hypothetical protein